MVALEFVQTYIVSFVVILTILVFVHELGHYWVARRCGVRVEVFAIGFGPEIRGWTDRRGTRWKIGAIPLGGYVKMFGEAESLIEDGAERPLTAAEEAVSFHHQRLARRAAIVFAGPLANLVFAVVVLAGLYGVVGSPEPLAAVGSVQPESAAAEAGLQAGDRIWSIDGRPITWFEDLRQIVSESPGVPLVLEVERAGARIAVRAVPRVVPGEGIGRLGVGPDPDQVVHERQGPIGAVWLGVRRTALLSGQILAYVGQIVTRARPADELGGPLRIAQMSGEMAQRGVGNFLFFLAALSVNLGLINLFPIPMLDGGHLAFFAIEAVRGRPLGPKAQEYGFRFGVILLFLLMIFVTWNDLVRLTDSTLFGN